MIQETRDNIFGFSILGVTVFVIFLVGFFSGRWWYKPVDPQTSLSTKDLVYSLQVPKDWEMQGNNSLTNYKARLRVTQDGKVFQNHGDYPSPYTEEIAPYKQDAVLIKSAYDDAVRYMTRKRLVSK